MAISKVVFGSDTLIDISGDSVAASALLSGYTAHGADGENINGAITIASASSYTPSAATQTIPSGIYLSGVQTIEPIPIAVDNNRLIVPEGYIGV